jgi:hypothetical protein
MEVLITGAMAVVVGLATGQFVSIGFKNKKGDNSELFQKIDAIERVLPTLIPRTEVQEVINKVPPLVAQQVQSELTSMAREITAQIPVQQPPAPAPAPAMPAMPQRYTELTQQNEAKAAELTQRLQEVTQMSIPQMEALAKQMPKRNRKPRQ